MIAILLMLILTSAPALPTNNYQASTAWKVYKGAWFEVRYPSSFRVRASQQGSTPSVYDSAFFAAPDGSVEFYIFSPQWNGDPADIAINSRSETMVAQNTDKSGTKVIRRATIRAKDGSYTRSFEEVEDTGNNTRRVFGIKYVNEAAYNRYRQNYLTFKQSLRQFAD